MLIIGLALLLVTVVTGWDVVLWLLQRKQVKKINDNFLQFATMAGSDLTNIALMIEGLDTRLSYLEAVIQQTPPLMETYVKIANPTKSETGN